MANPVTPDTPDLVEKLRRATSWIAVSRGNSNKHMVRQMELAKGYLREVLAELTPDTPVRLTREQMIEKLDAAHRTFQGADVPPWERNALRQIADVLAALAAEGETPPDGSVMVCVDAAYADQMRGQGLRGPFERIQLVEDAGEPRLMLTVPSRASSLMAIARDLDFAVDVTEPREVQLQRFVDILSKLPLAAPSGETPPDDYAALYENGAGAVTGESGPSPHWPVDDPLPAPSGATPPASLVEGETWLAAAELAHESGHDALAARFEANAIRCGMNDDGAPVAGEGETP